MSDRPGGSVLWPTPSADRRSLGFPGVVLVAVLVAASLWAALGTSVVSLPDGSAMGLQVSGATAVLAVLGLPSVPLRWIVRGTTALGALLVVLYGTLGAGGGVAGALPVLAWLAASVAALSLCPAPRRSGEVGPGGPGVPFARRVAAAPVVLLAAAGAVLGTSLLLGGPASGFATGTDATGRRPELLGTDPVAPLSGAQQLDMTQRPRLGEAVVLTVRSDVVSFWRTAVYDRWDGTTWTRSEASGFIGVPPTGDVLSEPTDLAARSGRPSTQQFRVEARGARVLPTAASPVRIEAPTPVSQTLDGELVPARALGRGATYRVVSQQMPVVPDLLRGAPSDGVPPQIEERYASSPVATRRVRELAQEVAGGADNDYDRVLALVGWMDRNTRYSLDAPLSPRGEDVVDHFLFESRLGWCEQIASSLVVMLREVGVPARLATGYVPGEWDALGGRFIVRERHAHAWAEVWFAGAGWVPFDPTADVPFAGEPDADAAELPAGAGALGIALLAAAVAVLFLRPLLSSARRAQRALSGRLRARRLARRHWDVAAEQQLERLGVRSGHLRGPGDAVGRHAAALAEHLDDPRIGRVGELVEAERFGPRPVDDDDRRFVDEVLAGRRST